MSTVSAEPVYLTVAETAERLRCGRRAVYALIEAGELRHVRIGLGPRARLRVPADALAELEDRAPRPRTAADERASAADGPGSRAVEPSTAGDTARPGPASHGSRAPHHDEGGIAA